MPLKSCASAAKGASRTSLSACSYSSELMLKAPRPNLYPHLPYLRCRGRAYERRHFGNWMEQEDLRGLCVCTLVQRLASEFRCTYEARMSRDPLALGYEGMRGWRGMGAVSLATPAEGLVL